MRLGMYSARKGLMDSGRKSGSQDKKVIGGIWVAFSPVGSFLAKVPVICLHPAGIGLDCRVSGQTNRSNGPTQKILQCLLTSGIGKCDRIVLLVTVDFRKPQLEYAGRCTALRESLVLKRAILGKNLATGGFM
jgi:hypothetical protein